MQRIFRPKVQMIQRSAAAYFKVTEAPAVRMEVTADVRSIGWMPGHRGGGRRFAPINTKQNKNKKPHVNTLGFSLTFPRKPRRRRTKRTRSPERLQALTSSRVTFGGGGVRCSVFLEVRSHLNGVCEGSDTIATGHHQMLILKKILVKYSCICICIIQIGLRGI